MHSASTVRPESARPSCAADNRPSTPLAKEDVAVVERLNSRQNLQQRGLTRAPFAPTRPTRSRGVMSQSTFSNKIFWQRSAFRPLTS